MLVHFRKIKLRAKNYHYSMVAASLALLVLLLSLASVSPELHDQLHAHTECGDHHDDHSSEHSDQSEQTDSHYCGVTALDSGATLSIQIKLPKQGNALIAVIAIRHEKIRHKPTYSSQSARGPPTLIVV